MSSDMRPFPEVSDDPPWELPSCYERVECFSCGHYPAYEREYEPAGTVSIACTGCGSGREYFYNYTYYGARWEDVRQWILDRDNHQCRECGQEDDLHVHHIEEIIWFDSLREANRPGNLLTLCETCHREVEGWDKQRVYDHFDMI